MILFATIASAATVAVLDFDGVGASFTDAQTVTEGVRDALLAEGALDPLSGSDIADGVSKGQDEVLRRARDLVSDGRRRFSAGDAAGALAPLTEALGLHQAAYSDVGRRPEMADAAFLLGACLLKAGRTTEARERFAQAAWLVPHYAAERGPRMSDSAAALLSTVEEQQAAVPAKVRPEAEVGRIAEALDVPWVVTGSVSADGALHARIYGDGRLVGEADATLSSMPPVPLDDGFAALAKALGRYAKPPPKVAAPVVDTPEDEEDLDAVEPPDFGEGEAVAPVHHTGGSTKIKTTGGVRYAQGPITQRWWFWTGAVAIAGGGAFGLWYALEDPPTSTEVEPEGWTVTVQTE